MVLLGPDVFEVEGGVQLWFVIFQLGYTIEDA